MSTQVILKILQYADGKCRNLVKLKKYVAMLRKEASNSSGKKSVKLEIGLRRNGVLKSLMTVLNDEVIKASDERMSNGPIVESGISEMELISLVSMILSCLGNAFAVDPEAVSQAHDLNFLNVLHTLLVAERLRFWREETNLTSRCLRCVANLASSSGIMREQISQMGFGSLTLKKLDDVYKKLHELAKVTNDGKIEDVIVEKMEEGIVTESARAIRVLCCASSEVQQEYLRQDAVLRIGRFLVFSYNEGMFAEVLKALVLLTNGVKRLPATTVEALTNVSDDRERNVLQNLLKLLQHYQSSAKVFNPAVICVVQLSRIPNLTNALLDFGVFEIVLSLIKACDNDLRTLEKLATVLVQLTSISASTSVSREMRFESGYSQPSVRLACSTNVGETVNILRRTELNQFHMWVLHLYENLYDGKLKDLVTRDVINVLLLRLEEEVGTLKMERLNQLMLAVETNACYVHERDEAKCPFLPQYSCSSPSYREVEAKTRIHADTRATNAISTMLNNTYVSSSQLSPPGSPQLCDDYSSEINTSPAQSPQRVCSDDEECPISPISSAQLPKRKREDSSSGSDRDYDVFETSSSVSKRRLSYSSDEETQSESKRCKTMTEESPSSELLSVSEKNSNPSESAIRQKTKKIVSILGILLRCSHFNPFPSDITKFLPFLLEMLWRGRLSVERGDTCQFSRKSSEDVLPLSQLCFQRSYKILLRVCFDIHTFSKLVEEGIIPIIFRILVYNLHPHTLPKDRELQAQDFIRDYSNKLMATLLGFSGDTNETVGYRQGYLLKKCIEASSSQASCNSFMGLLAVPLLYRNEAVLFYSFEKSTHKWRKILDLLQKFEDLPIDIFQNCILALNCIAYTKGLRWNEPDVVNSHELLENDIVDAEQLELEEQVDFTFDDNTVLTLPKKYFITASPVFEAMLEGNFREAQENRVHLSDISPITMKVLFSHLFLHESNDKIPVDQKIHASRTNQKLQNRCCNYELSILLELLLLSDQYFLVSLKRRVMNTLLASYFCPHSVTHIFEHSLMMGGLQKIEVQTHLANNGTCSSNINLTYLALKYLLVGENICYTMRTSAFRKVFENTNSDVIVRNLAYVMQIDS